MNELLKCKVHKRNFIPTQCKECRIIVEVEKIERGIEEYGKLINELINNCECKKDKK